MNVTMRTWLRGLCASGLLIGLIGAVELQAAKPSPADDLPAVDLFDAIKAKDIEVRMLPRDEKVSRVIIKNNTRKPLNVKLPDAFGAVPVLAQRGLGGGANRGGVGGAQGGQQQSMGGGMGGGGGGMMGGMGGMGGGMMNLPAEKVAQFKVATVCLEHGKKEPRRGMQYEIKPIDEVSTRSGVKELLTAFGKGELNQRATQAAAWHLANDMSWEQLAAKTLDEWDGSSQPWFSGDEIQAAMQLAMHSKVAAQQAAVQSASQAASRSQSASRAD